MAADEGGRLAAPAVDPRKEVHRFPIVGIGASAGGLEAVTKLLQRLPEDPGLAFAVVIHLAADRPSSLPQLLSRATQLPVHEATDGMTVERNHVYVLPPNAEMTLAGNRLRLHARGARAAEFKPIDALLASLAREHGSSAMGIVLSGADADGAAGLQAIKAKGGSTFAQDETARVPGMPESSIATGAVDFILPPEAIADELVRLALQPEARIAGAESWSPEAKLDEPEFQEIVRLLHEATGVDFSQYRSNTMRRRILRRMGLHRIPDVAEFIELLRGNTAELKSLHTDILIHVTQFFRDAEAFVALERLVIPELVHRPARSLHDPIRIWVPGCATGEEVYSIAICVLEALGDATSDVPIQVFGTDISESALGKARAGTYGEDIAADVSQERLRRFFTKTDSLFQVNKALRDVCVFARHDVAHDPPFSSLDLISCRNLLIYMSAPLQKRVIPLLHYGLKPSGHLLLGSAESLGPAAELFTPLDKRRKLYRKVATEARSSFPRSPFALPSASRAISHEARAAALGIDVEREADRLLLDTYAPPGVIIDERMEVLHFRGRTGAYLEPPPGRASFNLLSMTREGLRAGLLHAVHMALEGDGPGEALGHLEGEDRDVQIRVTALGPDAASGRRCLLVLFDSGAETAAIRAPTPRPRESELPAEGTAAELARARQEVTALRLHLQSVIERYEVAHEELHSANEEICSSNEELQSTNEELGTAKEELQSSNEELSTVNDELQTRIAELGRSNDDLHNVMSSVQIPIVILTQDLRIRSFTPAAGPLLNLIATDVGRPISHINTGVLIPDLISTLIEVLDSLAIRTQEVRDMSGRWHTLRVRPYRTRENKIDGVIVVLEDVHEIKLASESIAAARDYSEAIVATVSQPLLVLDGDLSVCSANEAYYRLFQTSRGETEGRLFYKLGNGQWETPELRMLLEEVIPRDRHMSGFEVTHSFPWIGARTMSIHAGRIDGKATVPARVLLAIEDVTERKRHERKLIEERDHLIDSDSRKNEFLAILAHELRNPLAPICHAADLLRETPPPDPTAGHAVEVIARQSAHIARLLEDLLDVSRVTYGRVELRKQSMDLRTPIERAVESVRPLVETRRQRLRVTLPAEPLALDADGARIEQIVSNLLNNAAKYTDAGGRIELTAHREDDLAVVRVRDDGAGISAAVLPGIFDLFSQVDTDTDRSRGGLGIGLTVVRRLVELHGGSVEAHSAGLGQGSEFVVRLPTSGNTLPEKAGAAIPPPSRQQWPAPDVRRVLVVDDNADVAATLCMLLRKRGHDVLTVRDGPAALEAAGAFCPDLVLVDIGLPGMNGYQVARELRRQSGLEKTRLIAVSGYGQPEDRERSREAGFEQHLVKPVSRQTLDELFASGVVMTLPDRIQ